MKDWLKEAFSKGLVIDIALGYVLGVIIYQVFQSVLFLIIRPASDALMSQIFTEPGFFAQSFSGIFPVLIINIIIFLILVKLVQIIRHWRQE